MRPWHARLRNGTRDELNALAEEARIVTDSGRPVRFVEPSRADPYYEIHVFETGRVHTRADNWHDLFNALAWLAFPRAKARINALHAATIPVEDGRRGPLRDLLTIFDEGGAVRTPSRTVVFGHATMEQALEPWPGIACKILPVDADDDLDLRIARAIGALAPHGSPKSLVTHPVFRELPGWLPGYTAGKESARQPLSRKG